MVLGINQITNDQELVDNAEKIVKGEYQLPPTRSAMIDSVLLMLADFHKRTNDQNQQQLILKQVIDTLKNELLPEGLDQSWNEINSALI